MGESGPCDMPASTRILTGNDAAADHTCAGPSPATITQVTVTRVSRLLFVCCAETRRFMPDSLCAQASRAHLRANRIMSRLSGRDLNRGRRRAMLGFPRGQCCAGVLTQPTRNYGHPTGIERGDMAKPAARGVERHLRDPAPVGTNCRQNPPRADALGEPRLARD